MYFDKWSRHSNAGLNKYLSDAKNTTARTSLLQLVRETFAQLLDKERHALEQVKNIPVPEKQSVDQMVITISAVFHPAMESTGTIPSSKDRDDG